MPVLVRNAEGGPTVFSDPASKIQIEWGGNGHPDGEDLQQVPDELLTNVQFMRAIQRGVLVVEEADEASRATLEQQAEAFRSRKEASDLAATESIDQATQNDLVQADCVGPNARGTGDCGEPVAVREKERQDRPPLCDRHRSLASQFVLTDDPTLGEDGKPKGTKWMRTSMSAEALPDARGTVPEPVQ